MIAISKAPALTVTEPYVVVCVSGCISQTRPSHGRTLKDKSHTKGVVQVYAPTADSTYEEIERFYEDMERVLNELPNRDIKVIVEDWNAKIGTDNSGYETVMGKYGEQNNRGERLLDSQQKDIFLYVTQDSSKKKAEFFAMFEL